MCLIRLFNFSLLVVGLTFLTFGGTLEASDDIERELGYTNYIRSSNTPHVTLESTLPTVEQPPVVTHQYEPVQAAVLEEPPTPAYVYEE